MAIFCGGEFDLGERMVGYLVNAFSLAMLAPGAFNKQGSAVVIVTPLHSLDEVRRWLGQGFISAVGHQSTAELLTQLLGLPVEANRVQVTLRPGDQAIVFQLLSRLPEGKVLNEEELKQIQFKFFLVTVMR